MLKPGDKLCITPQLVFLKNIMGWNLLVNKWSPYSHFVNWGIFLLFSSSFINMFLLLLFFSCSCFFSFRFIFFFFFFIPLDIKRMRDSPRELPLTLDYQSWKAPIGSVSPTCHSQWRPRDKGQYSQSHTHHVFLGSCFQAQRLPNSTDRMSIFG